MTSTSNGAGDSYVAAFLRTVLAGGSWDEAARAGAIGGAWACGTTAVIYYLGILAEKWLHRFSWVGLVVALLIGLASTLLVRHRAAKNAAAHPDPADAVGTSQVPVAADDGDG